MPARRGHTTGAEPPATTQEVVALAELHAALANGWISARYQPVVRMADWRPVALEVLARLEHPTRGTLAPDLFIPQMEDAGLAWPLTQAVVRRAFTEFDGARLSAMDVSLAVNFPLDVLLGANSSTWLQHACATSGIAPAQITVELTESQPVGQLEPLRNAVLRLRAGGFGLAIDDVGPAIRDHTPLLDLAFSTMKLDKDLVRDNGSPVAATAFLARALAAARHAHLNVIAEGVEDAAVWQRMADLGVDQAQGYLIARPLRAAEVAEWYAGWCVSHNIKTPPQPN